MTSPPVSAPLTLSVTAAPYIPRSVSLMFHYITFYLINPTSLAKPHAVQHLETEFNNFNVEVGFVCETWFKPHIADSDITPLNYSVIRKDRLLKKGGGVCIYARNSLSVTAIDFLPNSSEFEVLWCIVNDKCYCYVLCCCYYPPTADYTAASFTEYLSNCVDLILSKITNCIFIIMGDFNQLNTSFLETDFGFTQTVDTVTHGNNVLDKVFVNRPDIYSSVVFRSIIKTKHSAVLTKQRDLSYLQMNHATYSNECTFTVYDLRSHNVDKLRFHFAMFDWNFLRVLNDLDTMYAQFVYYVKSIIAYCIPVKHVRMKPTDPDYITPFIKSLLIERNHLNRIGCVVEAAALAERINTRIITARSKKFVGLENATAKELWAKVGSKGRSGRSNTFSDILTDADFVNDFFANVAFDKTIVTPVSHCSQTQITRHVSLDNGDNNNCLVDYDPCTIERSLRTTRKTSPGVDDIPYWVFSNCSFELSDVVTYLFNVSLTCGMVPVNWHIAHVTPIPKISKPSNVSDFRPISVTPILSRILERLVVKDYLLPSLSQEALKDQFGFKPTGSTTCALTYLVHHVTVMLESNPYVRCFMIDFAKAFDQVNHAILLQKLQKLDLPPNIMSWILSFLTDRYQVTKLGIKYSSAKPINQGVVQGSALGPFLFLVMISDLRTLSNLNELLKYADDVNMLCPANADVTPNEELEHILKWAAENKMHINVKKTKELVFHRPHPSNLSLPPPIDNIVRVSEARLLGVILCSNLNFEQHVISILSQCSQRIYLLKLLRAQGLPIRQLSIIYQALIVSRITYAVSAWGGFITKEIINRINAFLRRSKKYKVTDRIAIYDELLTKADVMLFNNMQKSRHCLNMLLPNLRLEQNSYNLRRRGHEFVIPHCNSSLHKKSFVPRCLFKFV